MIKFRVVRIDEIKSSFPVAPVRVGSATVGTLLPQPDRVLVRREAWLTLENADAPPTPKVYLNETSQAPLLMMIADLARLGDDVKNGDVFEFKKVEEGQ